MDETDSRQTVVAANATTTTASSAIKRNSWNTAAALPPSLTASCPQDTKHPLTVFAKLLIQPNYESQFEQWYQEITRLQQDNWPGYLSSELLKPSSCSSSNEYISIFRYDSYEHLQAWMSSPQRQAMLERAKQFAQAPPILSFHSLEFWFVHEDKEKMQPSAAAADAAPRPPAKYKTVLVTFLVIWAMNQWTGKLLLLIFGKGTLSPVWFQGLAVFLTVLVAAYLAIPIVTALLGVWLFPHLPYTTSLRNGFMSLPWPVPKLVSWLLSTTKGVPQTTAEATTAPVEPKNKESV